MVSKHLTPGRHEPWIGPLDGRRPPQSGAGTGVVPRRPWHQWHTSMRVDEPIPLEVGVRKRPQWGRYVYLLIIALVVVGLGKVAFSHVYWYNASGMLAGQDYTVSTMSPATVKDVLVKPSQHVHAGQPLARLDSPQLRHQLARDDRNLAQMRAHAVSGSAANQVAALRAQAQSLAAQAHALNTRMSVQQTQISSIRTLIAEGAANLGDLVPLQAKLAKTRGQYHSTHAELQGIRAQLHNISNGSQAPTGDAHAKLMHTLRQQRNQLRSRLADLTLTAPVSGQVAKINVTPGSVLRPGDKAFVIVADKNGRTYLFFPPAAQHRLHVGQHVAVNGPNGKQVDMRITNIYPSLQDMPSTDAAATSNGSPKVVATAVPLGDATWPAALRSGTPVTSRIPRWSAPAHWWHELSGLWQPPSEHTPTPS